MNNKIAIIICFVVTILFVTYRPLYLVLLFTLFSYEHFLFLNLVVAFLKAKKSDYYACFSVAPLKTTDIGTYKIWLKINEIYAYRRLYTMVMAKKLNLKSVLFATVVIFLGLPVKIFKLIKFLLQRNTNLHESLICLYFLHYSTVNGKKIEVIFKKTYLNPSTRESIIGLIIKLNPRASQEKIAQIYTQLILTNHSFIQNNERLNRDTSSFVLGHLKTEEGVKVKIPHWTNASTWKINGEKMLCAVHATSNAPEKLSETQIRSIAMKELITTYSTKPASIVTHGGYTFRPVKYDQKLIKSWELHYVMYDIYKTDVESPYIKEFIDRDSKIIEILGPAASNTDINEFSACIHSEILENDYNKTHKELLDEINNMIK